MNAAPQIAEALARLPAYLGGHVAVSVTALLLGLAISLPLAFASMRRPALRSVLLGAASVVQTIPSLALLALFYPLLLGIAALTERSFGAGFSALGFLPSVLALTLYSMLPVLRNTIAGLNGIDPAISEAALGVGMTRRQSLVDGRAAAGAAGHHGRHPHRGDLGDRRRDAVDADRPDQPRQLHLHRAADAELGVRAVRLRRGGGVRAAGRSASGADGERPCAAKARMGRGRRPGDRAAHGRGAGAGAFAAARRLRHRHQAVHRAICAGRADRAAAAAKPACRRRPARAWAPPSSSMRCARARSTSMSTTPARSGPTRCGATT